MPRFVELTSHLECHPDKAWRQVQTSALLHHGTHPIIRFVPRGGDFPDHTRNSDRVLIDAGVLTPIIALFACVFYAHRQRRWRALAKTGFAALSAKSVSLPR